MEPSGNKLPDIFGPRAFGPNRIGGKKTKVPDTQASEKMEHVADAPLHQPTSSSVEKKPHHAWQKKTNDFSSDVLPHKPSAPPTKDQSPPPLIIQKKSTVSGGNKSQDLFGPRAFGPNPVRTKKNKAPEPMASEKSWEEKIEEETTIKAQISSYLASPDEAKITKEEFLSLILEQDSFGSPRIFRIDGSELYQVLTLIKHGELPQIDLNIRNSVGKTLFTENLWRGSHLITLLCELNPSCINQLRELNESQLVRYVLQGDKEEADFLIKIMEGGKFALSEEELWIKRAFENDLNFADEEFRRLDMGLKEKIFFAAHIYGHQEIIEKLKSLGMGTAEPPSHEEGPGPFTSNMDLLAARGEIGKFLKDLRKDGLLLKEEEAEKLDKTKYFCKGQDDIGRIQGRNFLEKHIKENGLTHIKVPKKIAVINKGLDDVSFSIKNRGLKTSHKQQLTIYAERIEAVERTISLEEAVELIIVSEKTGYWDYYEQNYIIAKDGIYIIDTEFNAFSKATFVDSYHYAVRSIKQFLDPEDVDKFIDICEARRKIYNKETQIRNDEEKGRRAETRYRNVLGACVNQTFSFSVSSLAN